MLPKLIMTVNEYTDYIVEKTCELLAIDSPTGYTRHAAEYLMNELSTMGYEPKMTVKGGVIVNLPGKDKENGLVFGAHIDTLGGMVHEVKGNGALKITNLGGINPNNIEAETVKILTRDGKVYDGTMQLSNASIHVNPSYQSTERTFDTMEVVIDELVSCADDVKKLGIGTGDFVAFNPRTTVTKSGFIKSRFLDDKLSAGILLGFAKYLKDENLTPERNIFLHFTVYEEVGHGCSASMPEGVTEIISVDMGCVGDGLACKENMVSICAKDSHGPYNFDVVNRLIEIAKRHELNYAVDIYPRYGSDADAALDAGYDVRHGLIGAGVYASHGYERSHKDGVRDTFELIKGYVFD